ncbi:MAG: hypothetical protein BWK78_07520 [Thiotrichaceae bacterium IS1]|nr:MAG: hypothetical protein BWK78_07520 [Thiotrichaceae bacterium IS1]
MSFWLTNFLGNILNRLNMVKVTSSIKVNTVANGTVRCGQHAVIHNHGSKSNIILGKFVTLDGTLECYKHGSLIIGDYTYIGRSRIFVASKVEIGKGVLISDNVVVLDSDLHPLSAKKRYQDLVEWCEKNTFFDVYTNIPNKPLTIHDYVWIGANVVILKGITIGEGAMPVVSSQKMSPLTPSWLVIQPE